MPVEFYCGVLGLFAIPFIAWIFSVDRSNVMWKTVLVGLGLQLGLGVLVMLTEPGQLFFEYFNDVIIGLLNFSNEGAAFIFGQDFRDHFFAFSVLPTIIFFSALMSIMYYTGFMQKIVEFVAWIMMKLMGTSGAETLSVSSNIFVGQTEAPLVVKPFVDKMTMSELNTVMSGGFATVAGGVMAAYVGMLYQFFPGIAGHLLTASIMSAPAAIVMSKLMYPESEEPDTGGEVRIDVEEGNQNVIDAAAQGAKTGLYLALNVGGMLLAFIALVHLGDFIVGWFGRQVHYLFVELEGLKAFSWGAIAAGTLAVFIVGRVSWLERQTKYWINNIVILLGLPLAGYYLLPELLVTRLKFDLSFDFWSWAGGWGGLVIGLVWVISLQGDQLAKWGRSMTMVIAAAAGGGVITWLVGNSHSTYGAVAFTVALFIFICSLYLFWRNPTLAMLGKLVLFSLGIALLSTLVIYQFPIGEKVFETLQALSLKKMFGYIFSFLALLMGVPWQDLMSFGELIGNKIVVNEFVAFMRFQEMAEGGVITARTMVIASYALCGFANFSSIAIQIGGIGGIAPSREHDLARLGLRAMVAGALASFQTAAVAGVMFALADQLGINLVTLGG